MEKIRPYKKLKCSCGELTTSWDVGIIYRGGRWYHICDFKRNWIGNCLILS